MKMIFIFFIVLWSPFIFCLAQGKGSIKGVDFRLHFISGNLDFTSVSSVPRTFKGIGSELQTGLYIFERKYFTTNLFMSSRVMSWAGQDVAEEEYDDLATFSLAPGIEFALGPAFLQLNYTRINGTAYNIAASSKGKQIVIEGPMATAGFMWRFGALALGLSASYMNTKVPGAVLDLSTDSNYIDSSVSFSFIYFHKVPPSRFFKGLMKR